MRNVTISCEMLDFHEKCRVNIRPNMREDSKLKFGKCFVFKHKNQKQISKKFTKKGIN